MSDSVLVEQDEPGMYELWLNAKAAVQAETVAPFAGALVGAAAKVAQLEQQLALLPQAEIRTQHVIHAGMYARTIMIPKGVALVGATIKRATILLVSGDVTASGGAEPFRVTGHAVMPASAGRKNAWYAHEDTELTMLFPTSARTVEDAEREFTDETESLMSHRDPASNEILITQE